MKICIPTMDDKGLEGVPSGHFGSAPFFTFVDTLSGEIEAIGNGGSNHEHGACRPLDFLGTREVDAIICSGLGRRAFARLEASGIKVYVTREENVEKTLAALAEGSLNELTADGACPGHSHGGHGHGHNHQHGHAHGGSGGGRGLGGGGGQGNGSGQGGGGRWQ